MKMDRPYVVCHMMSALDGKITGPFMRAAETEAAAAVFGSLRGYYECEATLYGTVTMEGTYAEGRMEQVPACGKTWDRTDYRAPSEADSYIVSVDMEGILAFNGKYIEKKNRPKAHVIEILSENVSDDYIGYLRSLDISYIFAGTDHLDCGQALKKLKSLFGIEKLMISGGGYINWTFLQEDLIDELSLIIAPVADGLSDSVTLFEKSDFLPDRPPAVFTLKNVQKLEGDCVWLQYLLKKPE